MFPCFFDFDIGNLAWYAAAVGMIEEYDCSVIIVLFVSVEPLLYETPLNAPHGRYVARTASRMEILLQSLSIFFIVMRKRCGD